jgi:hypothetical protein
MSSQKIELSDQDISNIKIMAALGLSVKDIAAMLGESGGSRISRRTLFNLKRTDPRVQAAFSWAAGRANTTIARKLFWVATSGKTDKNTVFKACKYWELSRGGFKDPERRSIRSSSPSEHGRVLVVDERLAPWGDRL